MRRCPALLSLPLLALLMLGGCLPELYHQPPTGPTRSENTWLLGVWEMPKDAGPEHPEGGSFRAVLAPLTSDRMALRLEDLDAQGRVLRQAEGQAWISRVGDATLLVAQINPESLPQGNPVTGPRYLVVGYQLLDPLTVRLRELSLPSQAPQSTRFTLRKMIRRAFRDGTLFSAREQLWNKTGEIYWSRTGQPATHTFRPARNLPAPTPRPSPSPNS